MKRCEDLATAEKQIIVAQLKSGRSTLQNFEDAEETPSNSEEGCS